MSDERPITRIRIEALRPAFADEASAWAERLGLPLQGEAEFALQLGDDGLHRARIFRERLTRGLALCGHPRVEDGQIGGLQRLAFG